MKFIRRSFAAPSSLSSNAIAARIRQSVQYILYEPSSYTPHKFRAHRYFYRKGKYFELES